MKAWQKACTKWLLKMKVVQFLIESNFELVIPHKATSVYYQKRRPKIVLGIQRSDCMNLLNNNTG